MTKDILLQLMLEDLKNEYTHMNYYLSSSSTVQGLHRLELGEWLEEEAESEMGHVKEFSKLLVGLGVTPVCDRHHFETHTCPKKIVSHAMHLEQEVCNNYAVRIDQVEELLEEDCMVAGSPEYAAWKRVGLFYEKHLENSFDDLIFLKEIFAGFGPEIA